MPAMVRKTTDTDTTPRAWTSKIRALAVLAPLTIALGVAPAADTIGGFCRQAGSSNILPLTIDSATGIARTLPAAALGADRAGHFAAATRVGGSGSRLMVTNFRPAGAASPSLVTVDTGKGTVQSSTGSLLAAAFPGHTMVTMPGVDPWAVMVAQDASVGGTRSTNVFRVDVATGAVSMQMNIPFAATTPGPDQSLARC